MDQSPTRPHLAPSHEAQREQYHALSGPAVAGLILGLFSIVSLVDPRAAVVAILGIVVSLLALQQIARRSPELVGRKAALAGLLLSLLFGGISLGHCLTYRWLFAHQAQQIGTTWFDLLAAERPELSHQLLLTPEERQKSDGDIWEFYCSSKKWHKSLELYLDRPVVKTLLALGKKATVRPYATEAVDTRAIQNLVVQLYSVTFEQDGRRTTFLVRLVLRRSPNDTTGGGWRIVNLEGGVRPEWEEREE